MGVETSQHGAKNVKTCNLTIQTPLRQKYVSELMCSGRVGAPVPYVTPIVLHKRNISVVISDKILRNVQPSHDDEHRTF